MDAPYGGDGAVYGGVDVVLCGEAAESRILTVLHYDADFERVSEITCRPSKWMSRRP